MPGIRAETSFLGHRLYERQLGGFFGIGIGFKTTENCSTVYDSDSNSNVRTTHHRISSYFSAGEIIQRFKHTEGEPTWSRENFPSYGEKFHKPKLSKVISDKEVVEKFPEPVQRFIPGFTTLFKRDA